MTLYADHDATLIEHPHGGAANGAGPVFFVGRTGQSENSLRRALIHFDVASALPANAVIEKVELTLHLTNSNPAPSVIRLHRLLDAWNEGPSSSSGGSGATAQSGDVTWLHTVFDFSYWKRVGGHVVKAPSSWSEVSTAGDYTWKSSTKLISDVNIWVRARGRNFGWMLIGDEEAPQSSKRFDSRETIVPAYRPMLTIEYRLPGRS